MMGDHADDLKVMNFISAQAVKDATMAESIIKNSEPGKTFVHYKRKLPQQRIWWYILVSETKKSQS